MKARRFATVLLIIFFLLSLLPATSLARSLEEIQRELQEVSQQKQELEKQKSSIVQQLSEVESRLKDVERDIAALNDQLAVVQKAKEEAERELLKKQAELAQAEERLQWQTDLLKKRLVGLYKRGSIGYIEVLLGARDFSDFLTRFHYLKLIIKSDAELLEDYRETREKVKEERDALELKRQEVLSRQKAIEEIKEPLDLKRKQLAEDRSTKEHLLEQIKNDEAAKDELYAQLVKEQREALERARNVGGGTAPDAAPGTAPFIWPVNGEVTSYYGWRIHPIYGDWRFHYGLDIAAPEGTPVVAPANGTVYYAGWSSNAVGNTIEIYHGGAVSTRYLHLQSIWVSVGDTVTQGQLIGAVGNTGYLTTGPHLHFEVYDLNNPNNVDGTVDPLLWLP